MGCNCGKNTATRLLGGAVKLAKAELGLSLLKDQDLIQQRRRACEACPEWEHGKCRQCGCYTWAKTRLTRETCPLDRWPHLPTA